MFCFNLNYKMSGMGVPSMGIANIVIPVTFGISCIATVLTIVFTIVLVVYYKKIKNFNCEGGDDESGDSEEGEEGDESE